MWANIHLLFWLSLIPVVTAWLGEHVNETWPVVFYSCVALMSGIAYFMLTKIIIKANPNSLIGQQIGNDIKGIVSQVMYVLALVFAFFFPYVSYAFFALSPIIWIVPDSRIKELAE